MRYLLALSMLLNQSVNVLLGGTPGMTISARAGYAQNRGAIVGTVVCHVFDWVDTRDGDDVEHGNHCNIAMHNYEHPKDKW